LAIATSADERKPAGPFRLLQQAPLSQVAMCAQRTTDCNLGRSTARLAVPDLRAIPAR